MRTSYQIFYLDNDIKWEARISASSKDDAVEKLLKVYPKAVVTKVYELQPEHKPLFTTKHYKAIAKWVKENYAPGQLRSAVFQSLCKFFREDNPKFDESKFIELIYGKMKNVLELKINNLN